MEALRRLLDLIVRELDAADARVELYGAAPDDPTLLWTDLDEHVRVVAVLAEAPADEAARDELAARLRALVDGFGTTAADAVQAVAGDDALAVSSTAAQELVDSLEAMRVRAGADAAVIVDERSPEIWAADPPLPWTRMDRAEPTEDALVTRVVAAIEAIHDEQTPAADVVVVPLLGLYRLLVLDGGSGELRIEGAIRKARPVLERLLRAMPPREPPPHRAVIVPIREE